MKTIYWPIVISTCSHLIIFCWADYILDEVFDFCDGNGYKYVTFADFDVGNLQKGNSTKLAFNQGIRTRSIELVKDFHFVEDIDMLVSRVFVIGYRVYPLKVRLSQNEFMKSSIPQNSNRKI